MPTEENMYDDAELAAMRADQEDPIAMYFIVNEELGMGIGKIAAQVAHAAQMVLLRYFEIKDSPVLDDFVHATHVGVWLKKSFRKIILKADKKEFEKVKAEVRVFVVRDAGLTEIEPGSETVLVTWPMKKSARPKSLSKLQVLK